MTLHITLTTAPGMRITLENTAAHCAQLWHRWQLNPDAVPTFYHNGGRCTTSIWGGYIVTRDDSVKHYVKLGNALRALEGRRAA